MVGCASCRASNEVGSVSASLILTWLALRAGMSKVLGEDGQQEDRQQATGSSFAVPYCFFTDVGVLAVVTVV